MQLLMRNMQLSAAVRNKRLMGGVTKLCIAHECVFDGDLNSTGRANFFIDLL